MFFLVNITIITQTHSNISDKESFIDNIMQVWTYIPKALISHARNVIYGRPLKSILFSDWNWRTISKSVRKDWDSRIFIWDSSQKTCRILLLLSDKIDQKVERRKNGIRTYSFGEMLPTCYIFILIRQSKWFFFSGCLGRNNKLAQK